jgi:hypothetical protein
VVRLWPFADQLLHDSATAAELGDDGEEASLGGVGGAAVGGVVAEPDGVGDYGVEVGEMESRNVTGDAVDGDPGAGLPEPVLGCFCRERVVDVEGPADGEGAVGDVVEFAHGPLFLAVVDEERPDFEGRSFIGFGVGCGVGLSVGDFADGTEGDCVDFGCGGEELRSCGDGEEKESGETAWIQDGARWGGFGVAMLSDD